MKKLTRLKPILGYTVLLMFKIQASLVVYCFVLWAHLLPGQCVENLVLTSQAAVDDFSRTHGMCDTLFGNLTIVGEKVTNLKPLLNIKSIRGTLIISQCEQLDSLSGLDNLTSIEESLIILLNPNLLSLHGLDRLHSIGNHLRIEGNARLPNMRGLENLHFIGKDLRVVTNQRLQDFSGLEQIKKIGWSIDLDKNSSLINFNGLNQLQEIGQNLYIYRQYALQDLQGLEYLRRIGGELDIAENTVLSNLDALGSLESIEDCLYIFSNDALASIEGLTSLARLGNTITVIRNPLLNSCSVDGLCDYLDDPPGSVSIWENGALCSDIDGFTDACGVTSIHDKDLALNIDVSPNPVSNYLNLVGQEHIDYRLVVSGQSGHRYLIQAFNTKTSVDLSHFLPGMYFLSVDDGTQFHTMRLVKLP